MHCKGLSGAGAWWRQHTPECGLSEFSVLLAFQRTNKCSVLQRGVDRYFPTVWKGGDKFQSAMEGLASCPLWVGGIHGDRKGAAKRLQGKKLLGKRGGPGLSSADGCRWRGPKPHSRSGERILGHIRASTPLLSQPCSHISTLSFYFLSFYYLLIQSEKLFIYSLCLLFSSPTPIQKNVSPRDFLFFCSVYKRSSSA